MKSAPRYRACQNSFFFFFKITFQNKPSVHAPIAPARPLPRDVILDFEWRKSGPGSLDYQMVTWSKDHSLRMWAPDQETQYRYTTSHSKIH